jgi:hypothetical protein
MSRQKKIAVVTGAAGFPGALCSAVVVPGGRSSDLQREFSVPWSIFATFCESLLDAQGVLLIKLLNNRNNQPQP